MANPQQDIAVVVSDKGPNGYSYDEGAGTPGVPFYWQNEKGDLKPAMLHLVRYTSNVKLGTDDTSKPLSREEIVLIAQYFDYFIHAPCWHDDKKGSIARLRRSSRRFLRDLQLPPLIRGWNGDGLDRLQSFVQRCLSVGIDLI